MHPPERIRACVCVYCRCASRVCACTVVGYCNEYRIYEEGHVYVEGETEVLWVCDRIEESEDKNVAQAVGQGQGEREDRRWWTHTHRTRHSARRKLTVAITSKLEFISVTSQKGTASSPGSRVPSPLMSCHTWPWIVRYPFFNFLVCQNAGIFSLWAKAKGVRHVIK